MRMICCIWLPWLVIHPRKTHSTWRFCNGRRNAACRRISTFANSSCPFDPATKRSEAYFRQGGAPLHVAKGAPHAIAPLCGNIPGTLDADVDNLADQGYRVLAVAHGDGQTLQLTGLVSLQDPPAPIPPRSSANLHDLGIRIVMVTGDGLATAQAIARQVGIGEHGCAAQSLQQDRLPTRIVMFLLKCCLSRNSNWCKALQKPGISWV